MLRTVYENKEILLRIKRNISVYDLTETDIYQNLLREIDTIYKMDTFALNTGKYLIIGERQLSAYPLITVQHIVPLKNIVVL